MSNKEYWAVRMIQTFHIQPIQQIARMVLNSHHVAFKEKLGVITKEQNARVRNLLWQEFTKP